MFGPIPGFQAEICYDFNRKKRVKNSKSHFCSLFSTRTGQPMTGICAEFDFGQNNFPRSKLFFFLWSKRNSTFSDSGQKSGFGEVRRGKSAGGVRVSKDRENRNLYFSSLSSGLTGLKGTANC